jgi:hypothetical protein
MLLVGGRHMRNGWLIAAAFVTPVLAFESIAHACPGCSANTLVCLPGFGAMGLHVGLLLPILAGMLERPFLTWAGVDRGAVWFAICANCLSGVLMSILGVFALGLLWGGDSTLLAWTGFVVTGSTAMEYLWLRRRTPMKSPLKALGFLLAANVVSAVGIAMLPLLRELLLPFSYSYRYFRAIQEWQALIVLATVALCIIAYSLAFTRAGRLAVAPPAERHGFDVVLRPVSTP